MKEKTNEDSSHQWEHPDKESYCQVIFQTIVETIIQTTSLK